MFRIAINVYINFAGNCREAVEYYSQIFKTEKPQIMTFGEAPNDPSFHLPDEVKDLVMHTQLNIGGSNVMFSDTFPDYPFVVGNNISLAYMSNSESEVKAVFNALQEDGKVGMDLQETFWSKCYGIVVDKFGIEWQLSVENNNV